MDTPTALAAALFNSAVHVLVPLLPIVLGEQERDCNCAGASRFKDAVLVTPAALAVIVIPVWSVFTDAPVAVNVAVVWPAATVTLVGTVRFPLLLDSKTWKPLPGAAAVKVTVQDVLPGAAIEAAAHPTVLKDEEGEPVTTRLPDPLLARIESPATEAAATLVRLIGIVPDAPEASWNVAFATAPSAILLEFNP